MADEPKSLAEKLGRLILFPLAELQEAAKKKREQEAHDARVQSELAEQLARDERNKKAADEEEFRRQQQAALDRESATKRAVQHNESMRRECARFKCQMAFDKYASKISSQFSLERLHSYFDSYMSQSHPVELVEQRALELEELIRTIAEPPNSRPKSLAEITQFFEEQRQQLLQQKLDPDLHERLLVELNYQEDQAMMRTARNG